MARLIPNSETKPLPPTTHTTTGPEAAMPEVIERLGMGSSAALFLDLIRPVSWLGAQFILIMQPALSVFGAGREAGRLADYLEALDAPHEPPPSEEVPCR